MTWRNLRADVEEMFAELSVAYVTNRGRAASDSRYSGDSEVPELPFVATRFYEDGCCPGQRWLDGNEVERAAVVAGLPRTAQPAPTTVPPRRRVVGRPGRLPPLSPVDVAKVRAYAGLGLSYRAVERLTGIGRNRVSKVLRCG